jgi:putative membrane protein
MNRNIKIAIIVIAVISGGLLILSPILDWEDNTGYCSTGWGMMGDSGWGWIGPILMILFWGAIIWMIVSLIRDSARTSQSKSGWNHQSTSIEILNTRYAAGEIDRDEYERAKNDLLTDTHNIRE